MSVARQTRNLTGLSLRLRSVDASDAAYIVAMRAGDGPRFRYLNPISHDVAAQSDWIERQRSADGDYYFVIEDLFSGAPLGLIGVYDLANGRAEWGRWILDENSTAAVESVEVLMAFCFEELGLDSVYCRTVADNDAIVRFHDGYAERLNVEMPLTVELRGDTFELVQHVLTKQRFEEVVKLSWSKMTTTLFTRRLKAELGTFEFHHIGIATRSIAAAWPGFAMLGYKQEARFEDPMQGVRGLFMTANLQPRIELLENLDGASTLDSWLGQSVSMYHFAYYVADVGAAIALMARLGIRAITPSKISVHFEAPIVFLLLPNRFIIELIGTKGI